MEYPNSRDPRPRLKWRLGYYRPGSIGSCLRLWLTRWYTYTASDSANGRYNDGFRETMGSGKTVWRDEIASRLKRDEESVGRSRVLVDRGGKFERWYLGGGGGKKRNIRQGREFIRVEISWIIMIKFKSRSNESKIQHDRCTRRFDRGAWLKAARCEEFHLAGIEIGFICFV